MAGVTYDEVMDVIAGKVNRKGNRYYNYVKITYDDEINNSNAKSLPKPVDNQRGVRLIKVYALGTYTRMNKKSGMMENSKVIRAYQVLPHKSTRRGRDNNWRMFRLDRITSWQVMSKRFSHPDPQFNENGDNTMSQVDAMVKFGKMDTLDKVRAQRRDIQKGNFPKLSQKDAKKMTNVPGPLGYSAAQQRKTKIQSLGNLKGRSLDTGIKDTYADKERAALDDKYWNDYESEKNTSYDDEEMDDWLNTNHGNDTDDDDDDYTLNPTGPLRKESILRKIGFINEDYLLRELF